MIRKLVGAHSPRVLPSFPNSQTGVWERTLETPFPEYPNTISLTASAAH